MAASKEYAVDARTGLVKIKHPVTKVVADVLPSTVPAWETVGWEPEINSTKQGAAPAPTK